MIQVYFNRVEVVNDQTISKETASGEISVNWSHDPNELYTVIIYDMSAPNPPFVHFLAMNVRGMNIADGDIILSYIPPNPPDRTHDYFIDILSQERNYLKIPHISNRHNINLTELVRSYQLVPLGRFHFQVDNLSTGLTGQSKRKFCDCVLQVQSKRPNIDPLTVCYSSDNLTVPNCSPTANWNSMNTDKLRAYAAINNLPTDGSRADLLQTIQQKELNCYPSQRKG